MLKQDLLFEIGCEELPSKNLKGLAEALAHNIQQVLQKAAFDFSKIQWFATPRRLAIYVTNLAYEQPERMVERRGPALAMAFDAEGRPTQACLGFAKSCGVEVEQLEKQETAKGAWLAFRQLQTGKTITELLPELLTQAIAALPLAKPMRWGSSSVEFVRPVHWVVLLYGNEIVPAIILGQPTGRTSYGHRFLQPKAFSLDAPADYETALRHAYVEPDFATRCEHIRKQLLSLAQQQAGHALIDDDLLVEVTGIVEWPTALLCSFDAKFLQLPKEVIITALQSHQKCFMLTDQLGKLLPRFIAVSNLLSRDVKQVINGNERVVTARLADAAFFYETDCQQSLQVYVKQLKQVKFQEKLGSIFDKAERLTQLCVTLAHSFQLDSNLAKQAGFLAKADLTSLLVTEFPELQGIMGFYYAKHEGLAESVALAIREHYLPRFAGDKLPETPLGYVLALADRVDTLVGMFAVGEVPTGDKDPFGLRRAALGVIRIFIEKQIKLDLVELLAQALAYYHAHPFVKKQQPHVINQLQSFVLERMRAWYLEQGITPDTLQAVFAKQLTVPYDIHLRIQAVQAFRNLPAAKTLAAANKRVSNLLSKQQEQIPASVNEDLLQDAREQALFNMLCNMRAKVMPLFQQGDYWEVMQQLASLHEVVDDFFEHVLVMVDDKQIKQNRLALLAELHHLFLEVADISLLQ